MQSVGNRHDNLESAISAIRSIRQRELIRISAADLLKTMTLEEVLLGISQLTEATLSVSLDVVVKHHFQDGQPTLRMAMIGLGKLGGLEMSYASDADVTFVYEPVGNNELAAKDALTIISTLQNLLGTPAADPALLIDLDLRPEGKQGAIARSLDSYASYYEKWSLTWESQALLRAFFVAGDENLGKSFTELIDQLRYPQNGLDETELRDIRRIKARVESERLPRGADPATHLKLGPGGISDVEWVAQLLQLQFAGSHEELKDTSTLVVLAQLPKLNLVTNEEAALLAEAWKCAVEIRNKLVLIGAKGNDSIPTDPNTLKLLAYVIGDESGSVTTERYRRLSRRCRNIMEKYVYGTLE
jgi:glutamate-ammonia-ligase adenylyltransferase